jgi:photosystem II stability/assembly factor-like uncharacterized protein
MKKTTIIISALFMIISLSGCSLTGDSPASSSQSATKNENFLKSIDNGTKWDPKIKIDDKTNISAADVLSMVINPYDANNIYIGTMSSGIFVSKDAAETWSNVKFPTKVYGLAFDGENSNIIYASGVFNGRGKIFKREGEDQQWKEIYTEPADGTWITSLALEKSNSKVIYAGTTTGVLIKSMDGGASWNNIKTSESSVEAPVVNIVIDPNNAANVFVAFFQRGVFVSKNYGVNFVDVTKNMSSGGFSGGVVNSLLADPTQSGVIYAGMGDGILKSLNYGEKWEAINVIESSKKFPVRAMAINPKNSKEIIYSSSKAIYKSMDGGLKWSTFQLNTVKNISVLKFDNQNPDIIYAGLRAF